MGDRCYEEIYVNKAHVKTFLDMGFNYTGDQEGPGNQVAMFDEEANYGNYNDLNALTNKGIPFYGNHSEGGGYGPQQFCCAGIGVHWAHTDHDGNLYVPFNEKLNDIDPNEIVFVRDFLAEKIRAIEYCKADFEILRVDGDPIIMPGDIIDKPDLRRRRRKKTA